VRNTPQEHFKTSPAQWLMSRRTKTDLPTCQKLLRPQVVENFTEKGAQRRPSSSISTTEKRRIFHPLMRELESGFNWQNWATMSGDLQPFSVRLARDPARSWWKVQEPTSETGNILRIRISRMLFRRASWTYVPRNNRAALVRELLTQSPHCHPLHNSLSDCTTRSRSGRNAKKN